MITGSQNADTANIPRHTFAADQPLARRSVQAYSIDTWLYRLDPRSENVAFHAVPKERRGCGRHAIKPICAPRQTTSSFVLS